MKVIDVSEPNNRGLQWKNNSAWSGYLNLLLLLTRCQTQHKVSKVLPGSESRNTGAVAHVLQNQ